MKWVIKSKEQIFQQKLHCLTLKVVAKIVDCIETHVGLFGRMTSWCEGVHTNDAHAPKNSMRQDHTWSETFLFPPEYPVGGGTCCLVDSPLIIPNNCTTTVDNFQHGNACRGSPPPLDGLESTRRLGRWKLLSQQLIDMLCGNTMLHVIFSTSSSCERNIMKFMMARDDETRVALFLKRKGPVRS